jgi:bifunctional non-homologous end joining protein LigD
VEKVEGAMQTPDGRWRVEVVRRRTALGDFWYRIVTADGGELDGLTIGEVQRTLAAAGVDMADLVDAPLDRPEPGSSEAGESGVA